MVDSTISPILQGKIKSRIAKARRHNGGPAGLVAAIIAQAQADVLSNKKSVQGSALTYFNSPLYQHHLSLLDRPSWWLPEGIQWEIKL